MLCAYCFDIECQYVKGFCPWAKRLGDTFRFGCITVHREITPVVENTVGKQCSLTATIVGKGKDAAIFLMLAPSRRPHYNDGVSIEVGPKGRHLNAYSETGQRRTLTPYRGDPLESGNPCKIKLSRDGNTITAWGDDQIIGPVTITNAAQKTLLGEPQRFKFYSWQGCLFSIKNAVLVDGSEEN